MELLAAAPRSQNLIRPTIKTLAELISACASNLIHMGNETQGSSNLMDKNISMG